MQKSDLNRSIRHLCYLAAAVAVVAGIAAWGHGDTPGTTSVTVNHGTTIYCRHTTSGLDTGPYSEWREIDVSPTDTLANATPVCNTEDDGFSTSRWFHYKEGDDSCLFTASQLKDADGKIVVPLKPDVNTIGSSGRDCGPDNTLGHKSCGYIKGGYPVFLASGENCEAWGVRACGGWCY